MVEKTILPCGLTVISERFPQFPSLSLSYTLKSGARCETEADAGLMHLIEHMLFKGCDRYDLRQIADLSDRLGGGLNAYTAKETTQFYLKAIDRHFEPAFDLLSRLVTAAVFPADEFEKEKNVALQEIRESADTPDIHAFEVFYEKTFPGSGLGLPIDGRERSVSAFDRDRVFSAYRRLYVPANLVLSAAGSIGHGELVAAASRFFSGWPRQEPAVFSFPPARFSGGRSSETNAALQQHYVIVGMESLAHTAPERHRLQILNHILGGGMSSRLFQSIREEKGLAYTISSFTEAYAETGLFIIYGVVEPEQTGAYLQAVREEVRRMREDGISADELAGAKEHILAATLLSLESNTTKMRFNTASEIYFNREQTLEEIMTDIQAATAADIADLAGRCLGLEGAATFVYGQQVQADA